MKNRVLSVFVSSALVVSAFGLAACSASIEAPTGQAGGGGNPPARQNPVVGPKKTLIEGRWHLDCSPAGQGAFGKGDMNFQDDRFLGNLEVFADKGCTQKFTDAKVSGTFSIPSEGKIDLNHDDGSKMFDVFAVENGILYFSKEAAETADARPSAIDRAAAYKYVGAAVIGLE